MSRDLHRNVEDIYAVLSSLFHLRPGYLSPLLSPRQSHLISLLCWRGELIDCASSVLWCPSLFIHALSLFALRGVIHFPFCCHSGSGNSDFHSLRRIVTLRPLHTHFSASWKTERNILWMRLFVPHSIITSKVVHVNVVPSWEELRGRCKIKDVSSWNPPLRRDVEQPGEKQILTIPWDRERAIYWSVQCGKDANEQVNFPAKRPRNRLLWFTFKNISAVNFVCTNWFLFSHIELSFFFCSDIFRPSLTVNCRVFEK